MQRAIVGAVWSDWGLLACWVEPAGRAGLTPGPSINVRGSDYDGPALNRPAPSRLSDASGGP
jgi:hypothetical protein